MSDHAATSARDTPRRLVFAALLLGLLVSSIPLALSRALPLYDYPNHLARCHVMASLDRVPELREFYRPNAALVPNLAMDAVVVPLARWMPVETAGRLFAFLTFAALAGGAAALGRVLSGRWSLWLLAPLLLLYSFIFTFGFLNYLFGLGIALGGFAAYLALRERPLGLRWGVGVAFATLLLLCDLMALAIYAFLMLVYEAGRHRDRRREGRPPGRYDVATILGSLLPPALAFALLSPTASEAGGYIPGPLSAKPMLLLGMLSLKGSEGRLPDALFSLALAGVVGWLVGTRRLRLDRSMRLPLGAFLLLFLVAPFGFRMNLAVDTRLPIALAFILLPSLLPTRADAAMRPALLLLGFLLVARSAQMGTAYARYGRELEVVRRDLAALPPGALLFPISSARAGEMLAGPWDPPLRHAASLGLLEKPIFVANLFAFNAPAAAPGLHRAVPSPDRRRPRSPGTDPSQGLAAYADELRTRLPAPAADLPPLYHRERGEPPIAPRGLVPLVERAEYVLYAFPTAR